MSKTPEKTLNAYEQGFLQGLLFAKMADTRLPELAALAVMEPEEIMALVREHMAGASLAMPLPSFFWLEDDPEYGFDSPADFARHILPDICDWEVPEGSVIPAFASWSAPQVYLVFEAVRPLAEGDAPGDEATGILPAVPRAKLPAGKIHWFWQREEAEAFADSLGPRAQPPYDFEWEAGTSDV